MTTNKKTIKCSFCGKKIDSLLPFKCKFCGKYFCSKHRLPEAHNCKGLERYKSGKLKNFKKDIGPKQNKLEEIFIPWKSIPNKRINKNYKNIIISVLLFSIFLFLFKIILSKSDEIENLKYKINELDSTISVLKQENTNLNKNYDELNKEYFNLKTEINSTIEEIENYESELRDSMNWFRINSKINKSSIKNLDVERKIKSQLRNNCFDIEEGKCYIKTGCFYLINYEKLNLQYKFDIETSEKEDKLQSLDDFVKNDGGDCEDYALFYKAEFNYILDECKNIEPSDFVLESWYYDISYIGKYWLNFQKSWYLESARKIELQKGYIYPNIVCGDLYDLNTGEINGHCVIAFTKNKIESINDLNELDLAPLIEPQDGSYMGLINDKSYDIYLAEENLYVDSYISEIITDSDFFLFTDNEEWTSYSTFNEELYNQKNQLINLIK